MPSRPLLAMVAMAQQVALQCGLADCPLNPLWTFRKESQGSTVIGTSTSAGGDGDAAGRETSSGSWRRRISRSPPRCTRCEQLTSNVYELYQRCHKGSKIAHIVTRLKDADELLTKSRRLRRRRCFFQHEEMKKPIWGAQYDEPTNTTATSTAA